MAHHPCSSHSHLNMMMNHLKLKHCNHYTLTWNTSVIILNISFNHFYFTVNTATLSSFKIIIRTSFTRLLQVVLEAVTKLQYHQALQTYTTALEVTQPSPTIGPGMVSHHDNFRQHWNPVMLASLVQKSPIPWATDCIISRGGQTQYWSNFCCMGYEEIGRTNINWDLCRTTIITFSKSSKYSDFCNTAHIDQKDKYNRSIQKELNKHFQGMVCSQKKRYMKSNLESE